MATDPKLETYLATLERALKPLPVSDRADIVTEIKSHVLSALERDPEKSIDVVLEALGPAESVANRYLLERGQATVKPPISPVVKWLVIGVLGSFAMILVFTSLLLYRFSPVLTVDEKNEKVTILGGMITVDGKNERVTIGDRVITDTHDSDSGGTRVDVRIHSKKKGASPSPGSPQETQEKEQ